VAQQVLDVQQLTGQDRNGVFGQFGDGQLAPYRVFNLVPDRSGGYVPYGRRTRLEDGETPVSTPVTLTNIARLVGFDEVGIASFTTVATGEGGLQLFRGRTIYDQTLPAYTQVELAVHLDNAGAYIDRNAYLVLDRDNRAMEPIISTVAAQGASLPPTTVDEIGGVGDFADIDFGTGVFVAVSSLGYIYRSTDGGGTWTEELFEVGVNFRGVAFGNGTWIAVAEDGLAWRSIDSGDTWTQSNVNVGGVDVHGVEWGGGNTFIASGQQIYRTTDAGVNWSSVYNPAHDVYRVAIDRSAADSAASRTRAPSTTPSTAAAAGSSVTGSTPSSPRSALRGPCTRRRTRTGASWPSTRRIGTCTRAVPAAGPASSTPGSRRWRRARTPAR
jgi:hypothetical protein